MSAAGREEKIQQLLQELENEADSVRFSLGAYGDATSFTDAMAKAARIRILGDQLQTQIRKLSQDL